VINTVKNSVVLIDEQELDLKAEAERVKDRFEKIYFGLDLVFLTSLNYFSSYFVDYEFNMLRNPKIKKPENNPERIFNFFLIKKNSIDKKDMKLIEELILALNSENQFLYEDDYHTPNALIKRKIF